jgi:4-azaleucine resistance transporter AzlC
VSSITVNRRVLQKLIPIAIGYLALGIACGILAQQAGLTPLEALGMSVLVFAGSGQFIGIAMMAQGAALVSIGLTIFIVNLRHLLFSSTLMNFFNGRSKNFLIGYAHGITDETFAVNLNAFETETDPRWTCEEALGLNITSCAVWSLSNALGRLSQPAYRAGLLSADRHVPRHLGQLSHRPENDHHRAGIRASGDPAFADRSL